MIDSDKKEKSKSADIVAALIVFFLALIVYANTLSYGFVWDATKEVVENRWITDTRYLSEIFTHDTWGFWQERGASAYYRPFIHVMLMGVYHLAGLSPWAYHLLNLLLHAAASVLVFYLAILVYQGSERTDRLFLPFIAASLFATHPIHTEAVSWVSGIVDLSMTFFCLASMYLYIRSSEGERLAVIPYVLSVIAFTIALLCKEPALTLPLILLAYDFSFSQKTKRRKAILYTPYLFAAISYLLVRASVVGGITGSSGTRTISAGISDVFVLFGQYWKMLLVPVNLNAYYMPLPIRSFLDPVVLAGLMAAVLFIIVLSITLNKSRVVFLNLVIIVAPLLPALYITAVGSTPFAERYLYLPSVGFVMLLAYGLYRLTELLRLNIRVFLALGILLAVIYSTGTVARSRVWKNDFTLWSDVVLKSPEAPVPHNNLGRAYFSRGEIDKAIEQYQVTLRLNPDHAEAHNNIGAALASKEILGDAEHHFLVSLRLKPDYSDAHNNIGILYGSQGYFDKAIAHFQAALKSRPDFSDAHQNLGITYLNMGKEDLAIDQFMKALLLQPDSINSHLNLARAYEMKGLGDKSLEHISRARKLSKQMGSK